jgi:hypothetical protein
MLVRLRRGIDGGPRRPGVVVDLLAVGLLAFAVRFGVVLFSNGGPDGIFGYDSGVYYSAADALIHGRVPYRDFILLHPPGLMLFLVPFAWLGQLTTDHAGFVIANTSFNVLAGVNAVLVILIARRWGLGRVAALLGGVFYACWWDAVDAEVGVRLEPLGNFLFLLALILLAGRGAVSRKRGFVAGLALGATCAVKIWWAAPVLVVLGWYVVARSTRAGVAMISGAVTGVTVIVGPFFVLAPTDMWYRVVLDQLGRSYMVSPYQRFVSISAVTNAFPNLSTTELDLSMAVVALLFAGTVYAASQHRAARPIVVVLVVQSMVLLLSPSYFSFYGDYLTDALALAVAAAAHRRATPKRLRFTNRAAAAGAVAVVLVSAAALRTSQALVAPFPGQLFEKATEGLPCVMTDSNNALILMNRLSQELARHCFNWVDVTGHTYFGAARHPGVPRAANHAWQLLLRTYLLSGSAVVVIRHNTGISAATRRVLSDDPVLARADGYTIYAADGRD